MENSRTEKLLAALLLQQMKSAPQAEKAETLSRAGFSNSEIAELLGTTAAVVGQSLYLLRQTGKRPKSKAGKKPRAT